MMPMTATMLIPMVSISIIRRIMCQTPASPPPSHSMRLVSTPLQVAAKEGDDNRIGISNEKIVIAKKTCLRCIS